MRSEIRRTSGVEIAYAFSSDGSTITWIDDQKKAPLVAGRDGKNPTRLPLSPEVDPSKGGRVSQVFCDKTGSRILYEALVPSSSVLERRLYEVDRGKSTVKSVDRDVTGAYEVSRDGQKIRVQRDAGAPSYKGGSWLIKGPSREKMFDLGSLGIHVGGSAWSRDGNVLVWFDDRAFYGKPVMVWKSSLKLGSSPPARPGTIVSLDLVASGRGGQDYYLAAAFSTSPPIVIPGPPPFRTVIPLANDALLAASLNLPHIFRNFSGRLDPAGKAQASIAIPSDPGLIGTTFYVACITVDRPPRISYVSDELRIAVEK